jgi:hypothetical protein
MGRRRHCSNSRPRKRRFNENHWKKQGLRLKSIQKVKADLDTEIDTIIGAADPVS